VKTKINKEILVSRGIMISLATLPAGRKLIIIARLSWNPAAAAAK